MSAIRVRISIDHYDGQIEVARDSGDLIPHDPVARLQSLVAAAEASAIAAMRAKAERNG